MADGVAEAEERNEAGEPTRTLVGGRYEVRSRLAGGGEAEVLIAHDLELGLDVVLKTRPLRGEHDLGRLRREAATLMRVVAHPGLPMVRSDLVDGDRYYMISDHVAGPDLHDLVAAQPDAGLPLASVLDLVDQLADTLTHLHTHQPAVVHGDVKPANVVLAPGGRAVLVDFGAAIRVGDDRERLGTPGFSAPEVLSGEPVSAASDVFSLAALTVYLLTGLVPKLGTAWPAAMGDGELARLERVLRRGLTWDPKGRPWSAADFAQGLRAAAETEIPIGTATLLAVTAADGRDVDAATVAALEAAGGRRVTTVAERGREALLLFPRTRDAARVAMQTAGSGGARCALHAGDLGGWHGATLQQLVDETHALIDEVIVADGDHVPSVICSPPVRMLIGGDTGWSFREVSEHGVALERHEATDDAPGTEPGPSPSPGRLELDPEPARRWVAGRRTRAIVGREDDITRAQRAVDRSRASAAAALVVVTGAAGLGKTRFLAELAGRADERGELVLVGRFTETGGAFEGFLDALGDQLFPFDSGMLERDEEGWIDRRRFFGRIASAIMAAGRAVTLVLDDVQWIDGSSLALLSQLLDDVGPGLAVLVGYRTESGARVVEELDLRPGATRIAMEPLTADAFGELAAELTVELRDDVRNDLFALTRGNPFFGMQLLDQLTRAPDQAFDSGDLPVGARDWILQRVQRLGDDVSTTLAVAAVVGRSFDVVVLADVVGSGSLETLGHLEAAVDAGLIEEGERPGEFAFVHAIVQSTLYESLSGTRRGLLHAATARRLEENGAGVDQLEEVVHHWLAADRLGDPLHAGEIAAAVATRATERLAHERAVAIVDRALTVLGSAPPTLERDRVEARLRVTHGRANFVATRNEEALAQLYRAADLAERADDPETLVQAALVASLNRRHGLDDPDLLRLLERASDRCPAEPAVLRAMLHIRRSRLLPASIPQDDRAAIARLGLVDLDLMDDVDRAMVETEVARACWSPDDVDERLAVTTRIVERAGSEVDVGGPSRWTGVLIEALNLRWGARVQRGDIRGALDDAVRATRVADDAGTTFLLSRSMTGEASIRAILGEHETAERLADAAVAISDRHNLVLIRMAIGYCIERDRGHQDDLARLEVAMRDLVDENPFFIAAFALVHAEAAQHDDARRLLGELESLEPIPRNWVWLATTACALETAALIGDERAVRRYLPQLEPFVDQWVIAAAEAGCWGPVARIVGLAAAALGDVERARGLLLQARDSALANGAGIWTARCHAGLADLEDRSI